MIAFLLIGAAALAAALGVITAKNAVHSVLWLIVHLCSLAVLYMTLHARFLGLVQILIYAGAVMVLFVFVLGLLSARTGTEALPRTHPRAQLGLAMLTAVVLAGVVLVAAAGGALGAAVAPAAGFGGTAAFGKALFSTYLLPFEGTALALLTAIVAVVALSAGHDEAVAAPPATEPAAPEAAIDVSHTHVGAPAAAQRGRR
jgi:NADH-quinone oxidoreductase subunit J